MKNMKHEKLELKNIGKLKINWKIKKIEKLKHEMKHWNSETLKIISKTVQIKIKNVKHYLRKELAKLKTEH